MNYRIIITEDHPLFRSALVNALEQALSEITISEASSLDELTQTLEQEESVDLVLLDLLIPGAQGFSALLTLRNQYPEIPVVVISAREEATVIHKAIEYGASGFIPKSSPLDVLTSAVSQVLDGDIWLPENLEPVAEEDSTDNAMLEKIATLTPQQFRVLTMLRDGLRNKQIAWELDVSEACIKAHATAIFRKLGVNNRTQAVIELQNLELDTIQDGVES
ncbi:response regulator transcription factor [Parendozoicomonas haliclonae]|uniref:Transcriptional regulatory protein DegU n=1 Tax=Parendozoicomonas haliclonae TaxID=1960125 RepID=A0A1X7APL5_9GAMM|nr:response regulator transcription factor [Parendozoicomonas haliclonae]SMA50029.1 Transcriptional regulatory protein DegU [Parendozoicomonas haliclonae]